MFTLFHFMAYKGDVQNVMRLFLYGLPDAQKNS